MKKRYKTEWRHKIWEDTGWNYKCPICNKAFDESEVVGYTKRTYCYDSFTYGMFIKCSNCRKRYYAIDGN